MMHVRQSNDETLIASNEETGGVPWYWMERRPICISCFRGELYGLGYGLRSKAAFHKSIFL